MNEVKFIIELCGEDRARIDSLTKALEALQPPTLTADLPKVSDFKPDPVKKALTDVLAKVQQTTIEEALENAQEATEASAPPSTPKTEEPPKTESPAPEASVETEKVSIAELQQLVIALCRSGKKPKVIEVVSTYGVQTVAAIPDDKRGEVFTKLKELEG